MCKTGTGQEVAQLLDSYMMMIIYNQLQAPVYINMVSYAWYAAKLITS
jgi:hypothetical protein